MPEQEDIEDGKEAEVEGWNHGILPKPLFDEGWSDAYDSKSNVRNAAQRFGGSLEISGNQRRSDFT